MTDDALPKKWLTMYQRVKDPTWPLVQTKTELLSLPSHILSEILFEHSWSENSNDNIPSKVCSLSQQPIQSTSSDNSNYVNHRLHLDFDEVHHAGAIKVFYHPDLDGNGRMHAKHYLPIIKKLYGDKKFSSCFEWCCGSGFIGFELLANGMCQNLYLQDIYWPAIESVKHTIQNNIDICQGRVFAHHSGSVSDLPKDWKFDLIVANPPYFNPKVDTFLNQLGSLYGCHRRTTDDEWRIHQDFYDNIKQHLLPGGVILMSEAVGASGMNTFKHMIENNGLYIKDYHWLDQQYYGLIFLEIISAS